MRPAVARVRPVPAPDDGARWDYVDAFELHGSPDDRTAEQWARAALEQAPRAVRWTVLVAHRSVLRFRLGPLDGPAHVLGWRVAEQTPDRIRLEAAGPLVSAAIDGRRLSASSLRLTTSLRYEHPVARVLWVVVGPLHRRLAPLLLRRAALRQ